MNANQANRILNGGEHINTLIVSAVKGGVGKTKVTAGIGRALGRQGKKVAFLDLDYFAPNLDVELEVVDALNGDGFGHIFPSKTKEGHEFVSFGQVYVHDQAVTVPEDSAVYEISQLVAEGYIKWDNPDYLVIDTAPTSSGVIQASLLVPGLLGTIIVSQPSRLSRADLLRSLSLMKDKRVPVMGIVVNQGYYICPQCGKQSFTYDLSPDDIADVAHKWYVPVLGVIPHTGQLDPYFDTVAAELIKTQPVLIPEDKKASSVPRRLINWVANLVPSSPSSRSK